MLPKVANHLLYHTTRAVAAAQNQTGHTIRNVLQLQSSSGPSSAGGNLSGWNGPSSSNSGWNGHGAGSGGAKHHPGSRPYGGYTGAGRAVTQAEITSNDTSHGRSDDSDEAASTRRTGDYPTRRNSISLGLQGRKGDKSSAFKTGKPHAVSRRVFNDRHVADLGHTSSILSSQGAPISLCITSSQPSAVRHESTLVTPHTIADGPEMLPPPTPLLSSTTLTLPEPDDMPTSQPETPPSHSADLAEPDSHEQESFAAIRAALSSGSVKSVLHEVRKVRSNGRTPSVALYNVVLHALHQVRKSDESLESILEVYNEMLARSVLPNYRTYTTLIRALTDRDNEIHLSIRAAEARMRKRMVLDASDEPAQQADEDHIARLRKENNFRSAMTLFQTARTITRGWMDPDIYHCLLRSCVIHSNIDAAIHIFAHLERQPKLKPNAAVFRCLIDVYSSIGDLQGAKDVFEEFKAACKSGRIATPSSGSQATTDNADNTFIAQASSIQVWNAMIDAYIRGGQDTVAIGLLEQMLDAQAGETFNMADIPPPSAATFYVMLRSFCQAGEIDTALSWFDRLLEQNVTPRHPYVPSVTPCRPDYRMYVVMLDALALDGRIDDLNRVYSRMAQFAREDKLQIRSTERETVLLANMHYLRTHSDLDEKRATSILNFLVDTVLQDLHQLPNVVKTFNPIRIIDAMVRKYMEFGRYDEALRLTKSYSRLVHVHFKEAEALSRSQVALRALVQDLAHWMLDDGTRNPTFSQLLRIVRTSLTLDVIPSPELHARCLADYMSFKAKGTLALTQADWEIMLHLVMSAERNGSSPITTESLLEDMVRHGVIFSQLNKSLLHGLREHIFLERDGTTVQNVMVTISPELRSVMHALDLTESRPAADASERFLPVRIDPRHSKLVDAHARNNGSITPLMAYGQFDTGRLKGLYPQPDVIARLIGAVGRLGHTDKVRSLYEAAQLVLATLERHKKWQTVGWFNIEDHMIIGLAHAGDLDAAHVHRARILDHGGSPSADAYGALIHHVKDTTDDAQNAMALFRECRERGVEPNLYLYNTTISKLAKARRTDDALALFQEMKTHDIWPSSVTYGAVIAACCRVGDAVSAEALFDEMSTQPNFRPRVPPYNTMMQLYTHTKPDRDRVLHYYNALLAAGVKPTAHTYKLLLDAYGSIEPIDASAMEDVFTHVVAGPHPIVQGTHWASLINSWGCVQKDLDRALSTFDSIATHPSTQLSGTMLPDAVVFEALINVLVTLRRTDLIPLYIQRLASHGIHMTAYIANLLIKGYASVGDIERSREVFESLADPPEGMAAPHNHAPHDSGAGITAQVPVDVPVYREPSTWEAMVRAELGNGQRDRAVALLERLQARKFPPAVYSRISGILLGDEASSPWSTSPSQSESLGDTSTSII